MSTSFSISARRPSAAQNPAFTCAAIADALDLTSRLASRTEVSAEEFADTLRLRESSHSAHPYAPTESVEATVPPGAFYLEGVSDLTLTLTLTLR